MLPQPPERAFEHGTEPATGNRSTDARGTYDERLNHVLRVATDVIAEVGYEKATMRAVAKAAGVSLAGLYHYFDGKERILFLIQFRAFNSLINGLQEKLHGVADPIEQLQIMVRAHVDYFAANMAALKVCSHEFYAMTGDAYEETRQLCRQYYELARGIVDRIFERHVTEKGLDRHVATMSLFGTLNWLYSWYAPRRGCSPTTVANQIASQFLHGVMGVNRGP